MLSIGVRAQNLSNDSQQNTCHASEAFRRRRGGSEHQGKLLGYPDRSRTTDSIAGESDRVTRIFGEHELVTPRLELRFASALPSRGRDKAAARAWRNYEIDI